MIITNPYQHTINQASRDLEIRGDSFSNVATGLGLEKTDKRESAQVKPALTFHSRAIPDALLHGNDITNKMATEPAKDAIRPGFDLTVEGDETLGGRLLEKMRDLDWQGEFEDGLTYGLSHGAGAILPIIDDGLLPEQWAEPLDPSRIRAVHSLVTLDRWELWPMGIDTEVGPNFGKVSRYQINLSAQPANVDFFLPSGQRMNRTGIDSGLNQLIVHSSRLLFFRGVRTTRERRLNVNQGFDDPIYIQVWEAVRDFLSMWGSLGNVMSSLGTLTYGIFGYKELAERVDDDGQRELARRMQDIAKSLGAFRAVPFDMEREKVSMMGLPLAGVSDITQDYQMRLSAAARIPVTKLFGRSAAGMNATGEGDRKDYQDRIRHEQETRLRPALSKLVRMLLASDEFGGQLEPEWSLEFNPLEQLNDVERAQARNTQMQTDAGYIAAGLLSKDTVRRKRFAGKYSFETQLTEEEVLAEEAAGAEREEALKAQAEAMQAQMMSGADADDEGSDEGGEDDGSDTDRG